MFFSYLKLVSRKFRIEEAQNKTETAPKTMLLF
jgi:hypothetical protein